MHMAKVRFSAGDCITFGQDAEDEVPLTQNPGLQSEVTFQGGRCQMWPKAKTQRPRNCSESSAQRSSGSRACLVFQQRLRNARTSGAKFWPTLWFGQMTAVLVTLVVGALVALTYALREAEVNAKEAYDAGRALDLDDIGNGTNITSALLGDGFEAAYFANGSLQQTSVDVVRGSAGFSSTGSSEPSTHDGFPPLKERYVEGQRPKHFLKTVRGAASKEKNPFRGNSLRFGNKGNRPRPKSEAS